MTFIRHRDRKGTTQGKGLTNSGNVLKSEKGDNLHWPSSSIGLMHYRGPIHIYK